MSKKRKLWSIYLAVPFGIAVIVCLITNYALDRAFTWSLIAIGGCIFACLLLQLLINGGKHRLLLLYAAICILTIPYLYLIEMVSNLYLSDPVYWVSGFGAPISIFWLAVLGILILFRMLAHANVWMMAGLFVLTFYIGEKYTNFKVDELVGTNQSWRLSEHYPVIYFGTAAVFLFIGIVLAAVRYVKGSAVE